MKVEKGLLRFKNCVLLRNHELIEDEFWVENGKIIDPEDVFFKRQNLPDNEIDCRGALIVPGFIDVQLNGGFGFDFSNIKEIEETISQVSKGILAHGVTSFCPTLVTSKSTVYQNVLPYLKKRVGGLGGAEILGAHVEGPFISHEKKGAHDPNLIQTLDHGIETLRSMYKHMESIAILTIAPELENAMDVIQELSQLGIIVSLGHSAASIVEGEEAVRAGASFITHLFNAMLPFHHRDPGLVGLLASDNIGDKIFYGIIADGNHTHPSTTRIAYRANPKGIVLVTDACSALGLTEGEHKIGHQEIEVRNSKAFLTGTTILAGSIATMISCVQYFKETTGCSVVEAIEAATLHPAQLLDLTSTKGTLDFGTDADFVLLNPSNLNVISTWIHGEKVYCSNEV